MRLPELAPLLAASLPVRPATVPGGETWIRAMPTRQLHITAGNAPTVPLISALRALLTKSAATIKLPSGAILPGALPPPIIHWFDIFRSCIGRVATRRSKRRFLHQVPMIGWLCGVRRVLLVR